MVAGTRAGVGKTIVTAAIVRSLCRVGVYAVAMKAVARGSDHLTGPWASDEMQKLAAASAFDFPPRALCGQWLAADDVAARAAGRGSPVLLETIVDTFQVLSTWADTVVVEDSRELNRDVAGRFDADDLARELKLPVVLVVGLQGDCVPLALARVNALARGGLQCAGWIANQLQPGPGDHSTLHALRDSLAPPCLGSIPWLHDGARTTLPQGIEMDRLLRLLAQ
jgi:dethiobiotin synthetase